MALWVVVDVADAMTLLQEPPDWADWMQVGGVASCWHHGAYAILQTEDSAMGRNTSASLGDHFADFVDAQVKAGRYASASETVRAGIRLLEQEEAKFDLLRQTLASGEAQLDQARLLQHSGRQAPPLLPDR